MTLIEFNGIYLNPAYIIRIEKSQLAQDRDKWFVTIRMVDGNDISIAVFKSDYPAQVKAEQLMGELLRKIELNHNDRSPMQSGQ